MISGLICLHLGRASPSASISSVLHGVSLSSHETSLMFPPTKSLFACFAKVLYWFHKLYALASKSANKLITASNNACASLGVFSHLRMEWSDGGVRTPY